MASRKTHSVFLSSRRFSLRNHPSTWRTHLPSNRPHPPPCLSWSSSRPLIGRGTLLSPRSVPLVTRNASFVSRPFSTFSISLSQRVRDHKQHVIDPNSDERFTSSPRVQSLLDEASSLVDSSMWEDALKVYSKAVDSDPDDPHVYEQRGRLLFAMEKYQRAKKDFEHVCRISPMYVPAYVAVARCCSGLGMHDKAIRWYDDVIAIDEKYAPAHVGRADVIMTTRGSILSHMSGGDDSDSQAMSSYSKALEIDPNLVDAWCGVGTIGIKRGHYSEAKQAYTRALSAALDHMPRDAFTATDTQKKLVDIYGSLGVLEELEGNTDKAIALFSEGISIEPSSYLYVKRSASYLMREDVPLGVEDAKKAIDTDPENHAAYLMYGQGLMSMARFEEARAALLTFAAEERKMHGTMLPREKEESEAQLSEIEKLCEICKSEMEEMEDSPKGKSK